MRPPLPRRTAIRERGNLPAAGTEVARAVTSNRSHRAAQSDDVCVSASLDDVWTVPNSVTCLNTSESSKEGEAAAPEADTKRGQNSTAKCSVTINFRITEEHFCCSSRESSLQLELEIGNLKGTRNGNAFPPQVTHQEQARKTTRDGVVRVDSTLVISSGVDRGEVVDLHQVSRPAATAAMDDSGNYEGSSTIDGSETPEYSPTDSESSETSDEVDPEEPDQQRSNRHTGLGSHFETPTSEESYLVRTEGVVSEKKEESCSNLVADKSDTRQTDSNEQQTVEEETTNLDTGGEEKCIPGSKEDVDRNSLRSGLSLISDDSSKTSVVCRSVVDKTDPYKNSVTDSCEKRPTNTEEDVGEEGNEDIHSGENNSKEEENDGSVSLLQSSLDGESNSSDVRSESNEDERVLSTEILSSPEEEGEDEVRTAEGEKVIEKALDDLAKTELVESPRDSETQGQGDTSLSHTDDTSSSVSEPIAGTKNEDTVSIGEETKLKLPKTLEHVSEVPRGIFESILYKLYNRMNQRSPRTWRDISRGPCVKQLGTEFSKEAMESPKVPKSHSVQMWKTQVKVPKSQLLESSSDMDDSPKSQSSRVQKSVEESGKSPLFETFSDVDDKGFESTLETSTDDDHLSTDDVPIRSSTPSQEVVVLEIRDELQKPDCSSRKVLQLIKKFGGKGSFKKHKKNERKVKKEQLPAKEAEEGNANKDVMTDVKIKRGILSEKGADCTRKESSTWLTNVSVKNLVAIFSEISEIPTSPVLTRRSASRSSKKYGAWQSKDPGAKASRTTETQTPGSEPIGSCSNVLLLVQPEYAGNNMLGSRFERKRSTMSVCLPASADLDERDAEGGRLCSDALRACASATGLLLVSTAEPVRVRALCSPDDNRTALSQLAQLLHMPETKGRPRPAPRESSLVRKMVAQWDRNAST